MLESQKDKPNEEPKFKPWPRPEARQPAFVPHVPLQEWIIPEGVRTPSPEAQNVNGRFFPAHNREVPLLQMRQVTLGAPVGNPKYIMPPAVNVFEMLEKRNSKKPAKKHGVLWNFFARLFWKTSPRTA